MSPRRGRARLRPFLGDRRGLIGALVVSSLASGLLEAGVLALTAQVATALVDGSTRVNAAVGPFPRIDANIGMVLAVTFGLAVMRFVLAVMVTYLPARIGADVEARFRKSVFGAFTKASWSVQAEEREGHLQDLMTNQLGQATHGVLNAAAFLSAVCTFMALVFSALVLNVPVALVVVAAATALSLVLRPLNRLGFRYAGALSRAQLDYAGGISEAVGLAEETQVFGVGRAQRRRQETLVQRLRGLFFRTQFVSRLVQGTYQSLVILLVLGGLAGLYWSETGRIATLGAVVLMLVRSGLYGQTAQSAYHLVQQASPYLERLRMAEARYRAAAPPTGGRPMPTVVSVGFDHVSFAYRPGEQVLADMSFEIDGGAAIGIVGPSGAGKSTLLQVLLRLREPGSGRFLINGRPATEISLEEWHRRVAHVPQDPRLLHATVRENIRYLRDMDDGAVERAARLAYIHDDIVTWPQGYETVIGQRADAISGGQRQRISLARSLAGNPEILVLDEPTSALDLRSESLVQESLAGLRGRITLFIVAHRLSTLTICDQLMVVDDGRLEAFGPTAEIERTDAFYHSAAAIAGGTRAMPARMDDVRR